MEKEITMTPREFLKEVVMPNLEEFEREPTSQRRALNSVLSADTLVAHIFWWCENNKITKELEYVDPNTGAQKSAASDDKYRAKLSTENDDYKVVRDIAKALKHVELTQSTFVVGKAKQIMGGGQPSAGGYGVGMGYGIAGAGAYAAAEVTVTLDAGNPMQVRPLVRDAIKFLEGKCTALGL